MKKKHFYACLSILGTLLPMGIFIPWIADNGLNISLLIMDATHNSASAFAWSDVIISALVLITFILAEGYRLKMKALWLPILLTCTVGVSLGFPLFLMMREHHFEKQQITA